MNIEKYTERARGFIQSAQSLAMRDGHQQFSSLHMLKVLLDDSEGLAGGLIVANPATRHSIETLEGVSGLDRWALARQFRAAFGTCPSNFRTMRQLDEARRMIRGGLPLAEAALGAGFADQSHMSRMFKRAYGLTPAKWAAALV